MRYFLKFTLGVFSGCLLILLTEPVLAVDEAVAGAPKPVQDRVRLAFLAVADNSSSRLKAFEDLLVPELSGRAGIDLVERADLTRILKEQGLSLGGMLGQAERVKLANLIQADGICLLKEDRRGEHVTLRLVDAKRGIQVASFFYAWNKNDTAGLVKQASDDIAVTMGKLKEDLENSQLVTILGIRNVTLDPRYTWLEEDLPELVGALLSRVKGVLVLERQNLGDLLAESEVVGGRIRDFKTSGVFLEGEIALAAGRTLTETNRPVVLSLSLRDASRQELGHVVVDGDLLNLNALAAEMVVQVAGKLVDVGRRQGGAGQVEAQVLLEYARRCGLTWVYESAHVLDSTNAAAEEAMVQSLMKDSLKRVFNIEREKALESARKIQKATDMLLRWDPRRLEKIDPLKLFPEHSFLSSMVACTDPEIREMLAPTRSWFRSYMESRFKDKLYDFLMSRSRNYFDNSPDLIAYQRGLIQHLMGFPAMERDYHLFCMLDFNSSGYDHEGLSQKFWASFYEYLATESNAVLRFYGNLRMEGSTTYPGEKRAYAAGAMMAAGDIQAPSTNVLQLLKRRGRNIAFSRQLDELTRKYPDLAATTGMVKPQLAMTKATPTVQAAGIATNKDPGLTLFTSRDPAWEELLVRLVDDWQFNHPRPIDKAWLRPELLLVDGTTVWAGCHGMMPYYHSEPEWGGVILVHYDLVARKPLAFYGHFEPQTQPYKTPHKAAICRWRDKLCVAAGAAGVFVFPADAPSAGGLPSAILDQKTGLPTVDIMALTSMNDDLYIGLSRAVVRWNEKQAILVANLDAAPADLDFPKEASLDAMEPAADGRTLRLWMTSQNRRPGTNFCNGFSLDVQSGTMHRIEPRQVREQLWQSFKESRGVIPAQTNHTVAIEKSMDDGGWGLVLRPRP